MKITLFIITILLTGGMIMAQTEEILFHNLSSEGIDIKNSIIKTMWHPI